MFFFFFFFFISSDSCHKKMLLGSPNISLSFENHSHTHTVIQICDGSGEGKKSTQCLEPWGTFAGTFKCFKEIKGCYILSLYTPSTDIVPAHSLANLLLIWCSFLRLRVWLIQFATRNHTQFCFVLPHLRSQPSSGESRRQDWTRGKSHSIRLVGQ